MKTCLDCFNLRAKIPITGKGHLFAQKLYLNNAVCWCREDHLLVTNPPGSAPRTRYFKNVFKLPHSVRLAFKEAETCPDFVEEDEDAAIPCNT